MDNNEIFLNNKFSLSNKIWLKPRKDTQELATNFQQVYQISYPLAIFLAQKGLEIDQIENFCCISNSFAHFRRGGTPCWLQRFLARIVKSGGGPF